MEFDIQKATDYKDLGKILRAIREQKNISLEQIQQDTKIRIKYLRAIEEGELSMIPGGQVYVKGFLKSYAESIGLQPSVVLNQYKQICNLVNNEEQEQEQEQEDKKYASESTLEHEDKGEKLINIKSVGIPIAIVVIGALLFFGSRSLFKSKPPADLNPEPSRTTQPIKSPEKTPENDSLKPADKTQKVIIEMVKDTSAETEYAIQDKTVDVTFEVVQRRCWILVKKDGQLIFEGILKAGDKKSFTAEKELFIRVGDPQVIKYNINGQDFDIPGGGTRNFIFKRRD